MTEMGKDYAFERPKREVSIAPEDPMGVRIATGALPECGC